MQRFTEKLEDGRNILRSGYENIFKYGFGYFIDGDAIEKLSRYEDLEEKTGSTLDECAEELEQYRAIGTVEECRNAVSKTKAMKVKPFCKFAESIKFWACPKCGEILPNYRRKYCEECGQAIFWEDNSGQNERKD